MILITVIQQEHNKNRFKGRDDLNKLKDANSLSLFPFLQDLITDSKDSLFLKRSFPSKTILMDEGDQCNGVAFVLNGSIQVSKVGSNGRKVILYRLGKGDSCILTIASVLGNIFFPATAVVEKDAEVIIIPVESFKELMVTNVGLQQYIYKLISTRLIEVISLIDELIFRRIDDRLIEFLLKQAHSDGDIIEMTHEELSTQLGTAREVISRILKGLEREGSIQLSRGKVRVLSRSMLAKKLSDC